MPIEDREPLNVNLKNKQIYFAIVTFNITVMITETIIFTEINKLEIDYTNV